jgi:hypothetical protein
MGDYFKELFDFVVIDNGLISINQREDVIEEIHRLIPLTPKPEDHHSDDYLALFNDKALLIYLNDVQELVALKYFQENSIPLRYDIFLPKSSRIYKDKK